MQRRLITGEIWENRGSKRFLGGTLKYGRVGEYEGSFDFTCLYRGFVLLCHFLFLLRLCVNSHHQQQHAYCHISWFPSDCFPSHGLSANALLTEVKCILSSSSLALQVKTYQNAINLNFSDIFFYSQSL